MKFMRYTLIPVVALALWICSACSATRECRPVNLDIPSTIVGYSDTTSIADINWWTFYGDSVLTALIQKTLDNNREFMAAAANVERLRQLYGVAKAELLPSIGGNAYAQRETSQYAGESFSGDPEVGIKAQLNWEADLWGSLRWGAKENHAAYAASVEDWRAMKITLIAETATAYFNLIALENESSIVKRTIETRAEELAKAKLRYEGGLTSELPYLQAQVEYNTAMSLIPVIEKRLEVTQSAFAVLMGEFPGSAIDVNSTGHISVHPKYIPIGLPSELLERRPDLRASQMRLKQATAAVGVAHANRFPKLTISLTGGVENDDFAKIFTAPYSFIAGSVAGPILDFGRKKRKYKAAVAAYDKARYEYEQDVLEAFKETADAITGYNKARETTASRTALRDAALKYMDLARLQYTGGKSSYLDVLDAQRRYLDAEISLSNAVRDERIALVLLYKVLGGGWSLGEVVTKP